MLAMLAEKTRGNLSLEEQRLLENSLTELRFRYVQISESAAKSGVTVCNASTTEPLVMLKHFGPGNPDLTKLS